VSDDHWCEDEVQLFVEQILIEIKATKAVRSEEKVVELSERLNVLIW